MKDATGTVQRSGNITSADAKMGSISHAGMGVVMSILSNMYSNKFKAVLREYTLNAWDAHVEAGQTRPIEVTLPTDLQPTLLIQDFGVGLSQEGIETFFLEYGESTKRDTDDQAGAFGIGSKSAFTMGHQFVVTGVKDGVKTVALLSLNEHNICTCQIIKKGETTEPNGVLISLAVEDVESMREEAESFFSFWDPEKVLVDGEHPKSIFERAHQVNENTYLVSDHEGDFIVVMGQATYKVGRDIMRKVARDLAETEYGEQAKAMVDWYSDTSVLFKVGIGEVVPTPDRESVRDTKRSIATVTECVKGLVDDLVRSVQEKVDKARTPYEAHLIMHRAIEDLGPFKVSRTQISFRDQRIKAEVEVPLTTYFLAKNSWRTNARMVVRHEDKMTADIIRAQKTLVVTGVPEGQEQKVGRYTKRFLENYVAGDEESPKTYEWLMISEKGQGETEWFTFGVDGGVDTMTVDDYKAALRSMRTSNPRTKTDPSYTTGFTTASRDLEDRDLLTDIMDWGKDLIVVCDSARYMDALTRKALEDYTVVVLLGSQSENALRKRVEEAGQVEIIDDWQEIVNDYARRLLSTLSRDEKAALSACKWLQEDAHEYEWNRIANYLPEGEITSPLYHEVKDTYALARLVAQDISKERRDLLVLAARHLGDDLDIPTFDAKVPSIEEAYPLVGTLVRHSSYYLRNNDTVMAEALAYINSK